jgi:hypothetical protein
MAPPIDDRTTDHDLTTTMSANEDASRRIRTLLSVIETDSLTCVPVIWRGDPDTKEVILSKSFQPESSRN